MPLKTILLPINEKRGESISIYNDKLTDEGFIRASAIITAAFPELDDNFIMLLQSRLELNNFTDKRLLDAIGYVVDTFVYKTPKVANFISFDQSVKILTHNEVLEIGFDFVQSIDLFEENDVNRECYWILKSDFKKFQNFKIWKPKQPTIKKPFEKIVISPEEIENNRKEQITRKEKIESELEEIKKAKRKYPKKLSTDEIMKLTKYEKEDYAKAIVRKSTQKESHLKKELELILNKVK